MSGLSAKHLNGLSRQMKEPTGFSMERDSGPPQLPQNARATVLSARKLQRPWRAASLWPPVRSKDSHLGGLVGSPCS